MDRRLISRARSLLLVSLLAAPIAALAQADGATRPESTDVRMLIYNVAFLPWVAGDFFLGNRSGCRGDSIGRTLSAMAFDIVVLNETMSVGPTNSVARHYPYKVLNQPDSSLFRPIAGGVSVLSRRPLMPDWHAEAFKEFHGINGLAAQGFVHAVFQLLDDLRINVIATHLDTFDEPDDRAARRAQLAQIVHFLEQNESVQSWPTFLLGDLNIDGMDLEGTEYRSMLEHLTLPKLGLVHDAYVVPNGPWSSEPDEAERASTDICGVRLAPCTPGGHARVDYILYWSHPDFEITPLASTTHAFPDEGRCGVDYLSDHKALETSFRITRK